MKDILEDIETRMFALDRALPDNSAARDLLEILHRSQVEIGKLREVLERIIRGNHRCSTPKALLAWAQDEARTALPPIAPQEATDGDTD